MPISPTSSSNGFTEYALQDEPKDNDKKLDSRKNRIDDFCFEVPRFDASSKPRGLLVPELPRLESPTKEELFSRIMRNLEKPIEVFADWPPGPYWSTPITELLRQETTPPEGFKKVSPKHGGKIVYVTLGLSTVCGPQRFPEGQSQHWFEIDSEGKSIGCGKLEVIT